MGEATRVLRLLANEKRRLVLCQLLLCGERDVTSLAESIGISLPSTSQHLMRLRIERLVAVRREAQTAFYRLADPRTTRLLLTLKEIFCDEVSPPVHDLGWGPRP